MARADSERSVETPSELGPLVELTAALVRAETLTQICERGLEVVERALGVERSSVLLFDDTGVMRFYAWSGISDEYRAATEGHTPWSPDTLDATPVVVEDVEDDPTLGPLRDVILNEGIRALAFVPISLERRVIGKYMLYFAEPHELTAGELRVSRIVADQIAAAVRRNRDESALRSSRDELRAVFAGVADAITVQAANGELVYANDAAARFLGIASADALVRMPVAEIVAKFELLDEEGAPLPVDELPARQVFAGAPSAELLVRYRVRATGDERASMVRARPIYDDHGNVRFAVNIIQDVTEQRERMEWQQLLADTSAVLAESLVSDETLERVAELAVPRLADWCAIHVPADGEPRLAALAHRDPEQVRLAHEIIERYPADPAREGSAGWVLSTGKPSFVPSVTDAMLQDAASDEEHLRLLRALDFRSSLTVPLVARGRTLAAMSFATAGDRRPLRAADLANAEEFARRAALALDNALLHEAEREARRRAERSAAIASRLQVVTASLSGAITQRQVAEVIAGQGVLALDADAGAVFVLTADGEHLEALAHVGYPEDLVPRERRTPLAVESPTSEALESRGIVVVESSEELVRRWPHYQEAQRITGDESTIAVPLIVDGKPAGALYVAFRTARAFDAQELELVETLARQCAQALERAALYEREHRVALTLQRSLLPQRLPTQERLELTALYRPGSAGLNVGGDWYDAVDLPDGRIALCVGDVLGSGVEAAAVMGELRHTVRPYLAESLAPNDVLQRVNTLIAWNAAVSIEGEAFATMALAVVDVDARTISVSLAGHPPPLLLHDGGARLLEVVPGPPFGVVAEPSYETGSFALEEGMTVLLYTDGLVEKRQRPLGAGLDELLAAARELPARASTEELCAGLVETLAGPGETADDVAVLALRVLAQAPSVGPCSA